ncbi:hypothetical protein CYMTET_45434 [Cymbomonas tetramitiformis]|uniref:Uncharacterized protein n=1 Tax=Cymbomonas tetramitiformis TaxID=36881 RepID=A0AAE0BY88_9CHLO|nr:hypothetical protein CYMTET_45434 [Cymbomonas tetramitiformis]
MGMASAPLLRGGGRRGAEVERGRRWRAGAEAGRGGGAERSGCAADASESREVGSGRCGWGERRPEDEGRSRSPVERQQAGAEGADAVGRERRGGMALVGERSGKSAQGWVWREAGQARQADGAGEGEAEGGREAGAGAVGGRRGRGEAEETRG